MIRGTVTKDGVPLIELPVAGSSWNAVVDTGFNGHLDLPEVLRGEFKLSFIGRVKSTLAGG